jgi:hypothetical protein
MSGSQTKNAALTTALAFHYQVLIGLDKCFSLEDGQSVWFEKDGDVSLISPEALASTQTEVKDYAAPLTDHHENLWKTLKNWLAPEFDHAQYGALMLHTTQAFGATTRLKDWNKRSAEQRLQVLKDIFAERTETQPNVEKPSDVNLAQARPMKAKFESSLVEVQRNIEVFDKELTALNLQITEIEKTEKQLAGQKTLYESILMQKAKLFVLLDTLNMADDAELEKQIKALNKQLKDINNDLKKYDVQKGLENASEKVNEYMAEIGSHFEFEASYKPINLHFSFETFDLYHLTPNDERIYLRSMGSGANWLYSHVTLFLALHKYFSELGDKCAIPSILFFDQPTQVYFPNFNRDNSETFEEQKNQEAEQRKTLNVEQNIDEDIKAVENLFSQLSIYCNELEQKNGFSPQIIVTDHADNLTLSNGVSFESLVNGNRWRTRGLIHPTEV